MESFLSLIITFIIAPHYKLINPVMHYLVLGLLAGFHHPVCKASKQEVHQYFLESQLV